MKNQVYAIGDNVEKICTACQEPVGHVVKSLTKTGLVSRVVCSKCGLVGTFKQSANSTKLQSLASKTGDPYNRERIYRAGQIMSHPNFGTGEVMKVLDGKTIDVLFMDRVRRLIHAR